MDLDDLRADERILGDHGIAAAVSARSSNALVSLYSFDERAPCAAERGLGHKDQSGTLDCEPLGSVAVGDDFVQPGARRGVGASGGRNSENGIGYVANYH